MERRGLPQFELRDAVRSVYAPPADAGGSLCREISSYQRTGLELLGETMLWGAVFSGVRTGLHYRDSSRRFHDYFWPRTRWPVRRLSRQRK